MFLLGDGLPHPRQGVVGVARMLLRTELEDMKAVRVIVDTQVLTEGSRAWPRDMQLVG